MSWGDLLKIGTFVPKTPFTIMFVGIGGGVFYFLAPDEHAWKGLLLAICFPAGLGVLIDHFMPSEQEIHYRRSDKRDAKAIKEELKSLTPLEEQILKVMVSHNMPVFEEDSIYKKKLLSFPHPTKITHRGEVSFDYRGLYDAFKQLQIKKLGVFRSGDFGNEYRFKFKVSDIAWEVLKKHYKNHFNTRTETFADFEKQYEDN